MAKLDIITAPDPRLKVQSTPVERVDDEVRRLMDDLFETICAAYNGIGLAAPQVGVARRVLAIDLSLGEDTPNPLYVADPKIIWSSEEFLSAKESCLSIPEHSAEVIRPAAVRVRYLDRDNEIQEMDAEGFLAICIQHEMDHLDGILFIDHLTAVKRNMILRKLGKTRKHTIVKPAAAAPVL